MNKLFENVFLKIKTKIWWLFLGLVVFFILWHKKIGVLFKSNVVEGARSKSGTVVRAVKSIPVRNKPPVEIIAGNNPQDTLGQLLSGNNPEKTPEKTSTGGSSDKTPAKTSTGGSIDKTPVKTSSGGSTSTSNTACNFKYELDQEVQVKRNPPDTKFVLDKLYNGIIIKENSDCTYSIKFCDGTAEDYDESDIYMSSSDGSSCPAEEVAISSGKRGRPAKKIQVLQIEDNSTPSDAYGCSSFTVMVTGKTTSKNDPAKSVFTTTGDPGSMPCPFYDLVKNLKNPPESLTGWTITNGIVVGPDNTIVSEIDQCKNKDRLGKYIKWSYIPDADSSKKDRASFEISSSNTLVVSAKDGSYRIYLTYEAEAEGEAKAEPEAESEPEAEGEEEEN